MAKAYIKLEEGYQAKIRVRDHEFYGDEPFEAGGTNMGPESVELVKSALGACMAITVKMYAERKQWPLEGVEVEIDVQRFKGKDYPGFDGDAPYVHEFTEKVTFHGPLTDEQRERLREIAGKCPVRRMLMHPVFFKEDLTEEEPSPEEAS